MNLYRVTGLPGHQFCRWMFAAFVGLTIFAGTLISAQNPSHRTEPTTGMPASNTAILQVAEAASLLKAGRLDEAERILRGVIVATPQNPDAHNLLGIVLDQREQFKAAEQEYREALRLNPSLISPLANLGVLLARTERSEEAIHAFETVLQKVPDHPQATLNLGLQYVVRADYARAVPLLEHARQRSRFEFAMVGHNAAVCAATQHYMAPALPRDDEADFFECTNSLRAGNTREARHSPSLERS